MFRFESTRTTELVELSNQHQIERGIERERESEVFSVGGLGNPIGPGMSWLLSSRSLGNIPCTSGALFSRVVQGLPRDLTAVVTIPLRMLDFVTIRDCLWQAAQCIIA